MDGKILIVDDNEDVLFALNLLLEPYVEKIKVTTSPARIEYFMDNFNPDIILLDMNFSRDASSGQEGFLWLEKILQKDPQAVVLFITAYADTEKAVKAIRAGAIDFIPKPWETENFWPPFLGYPSPPNPDRSSGFERAADSPFRSGRRSRNHR